MIDARWAADIVARMHMARIRQLDLAKEAGFSAPYLSTVLSQYRGDEGTQKTVEEALERLEKKRLLGEE